MFFKRNEDIEFILYAQDINNNVYAMINSVYKDGCSDGVHVTLATKSKEEYVLEILKQILQNF